MHTTPESSAAKRNPQKAGFSHANDDGTRLRHQNWAMGTVGLVGGTACGLLGLVGGLVYSGRVSALVGALTLQTAAFVALPLLLWLWVPPGLGVPRSRVLLGTVSWWLAAPFLVGVPLAVGAFVTPSPLAGAVALSLTAGIVEESTRAWLYRRILARRPEAGWTDAVVLGLGHGGIEALVFGLPTLLGLAGLAMGVPIPEGAVMEPWGHLLLGGSRVALLLVHVGFTLLVWRAVRAWIEGAGGGAWFATAVLAHVALDLAAFAGPILLPEGGLFLGGGVVGTFALLSAAGILAEGRRARFW